MNYVDLHGPAKPGRSEGVIVERLGHENETLVLVGINNPCAQGTVHQEDKESSYGTAHEGDATSVVGEGVVMAPSVAPRGKSARLRAKLAF